MQPVSPREKGGRRKLLSNVVDVSRRGDEVLVQAVFFDFWVSLEARKGGQLQPEELQGEEELHCPSARGWPGVEELYATMEPSRRYVNGFSFFPLLQW